MQYSKFIVKNELINKQIIKKYTLLSKTEYPINNPVCIDEHLEWKYLNNPLGLSYGINGYSGDELIARVSNQKKNFIFKNKTFKGSNLCDLLINKKYRKLENFLKLTNQYFIRKEIPESDINIMLPNEISINLYKKILNLNPIGTLELRSIPIINSLVENKLKIKIPSFLISVFDNFLLFIIKILKSISKIRFCKDEVENAEYEEMIKTFYQDNLIQGQRSKEWIKWRYNIKSKVIYTVEFIYFGNQLIGYLAYRSKEKYGFKILMIMEIVLIKNNFFIEATILMKLIYSAIRLNCDFIFSLRSIQKRNPLSNFLFPKIPNFLIPISLDLFVISNIKNSKQILDINNWKINMADLDIF